MKYKCIHLIASQTYYLYQQTQYELSEKKPAFDKESTIVIT